VLSTITLASSLDKFQAFQYLNRSPCHDIRTPELLLPPTPLPASRFALNFLLQSRPDSFRHGFLFARLDRTVPSYILCGLLLKSTQNPCRFVLTTNTNIDAITFASFLEKLVATFVVHGRFKRDVGLHGATLPRSWIVYALDRDPINASRSEWFLIRELAGPLSRFIAELFNFSGKVDLTLKVPISSSS
jgi:hypothetical protein